MTLKEARIVLLHKLARRSLHRMQAQAILKEKGFESAVIDEAIASLSSYFDDDGWISGRCARFSREGKSVLQVKMKLRSQGIPVNTDAYNEKEALAILIRKKYLYLLDPSTSREKKQKAIQSILRRGFSFSLVSSFLKENVISSLLAEEE